MVKVFAVAGGPATPPCPCWAAGGCPPPMRCDLRTQTLLKSPRTYTHLTPGSDGQADGRMELLLNSGISLLVSCPGLTQPGLGKSRNAVPAEEAESGPVTWWRACSQQKMEVGAQTHASPPAEPALSSESGSLGPRGCGGGRERLGS